MIKGFAPVLLLSLWILVTGLNCQGRRENIKSTKELENLVASFLDECSKRRLKNDFSNHSFVVGFGRVQSKAGSCKPNSYPKIITIDSLTWKTLSIPLKEMLVYHELAHCLLDKKHNNAVFTFGECKSWMRERDSACSINSINSAWRTYYINELFESERSSDPYWYDTTQNAELNEKSKTIPPENIMTKSNSLVFDSAFINNGSARIVKFNFIEPENFNGSMAIVINEYAVYFSTFTDLSHQNPTPVFTRAIAIQQYDYLRQVTLVSWDTLKSVEKKTDMSIKKTDKAIFVFFENDLKLCIPIVGNNITLSVYPSFEEKNAYSIDIYE